METLPGIAQVLRSPVADAFVALIRQSARHPDFQVADAEEVLRYAVRRNLMSQEESDRIIAEVREGVQRRAERAADRAEAKRPGAAKKSPPKAKPAVKAKAPAKPLPRPKAKAKPVPKARPKAVNKKKAPARKR
jgi:hypothetical protein